MSEYAVRVLMIREDSTIAQFNESWGRCFSPLVAARRETEDKEELPSLPVTTGREQ